MTTQTSTLTTVLPPATPSLTLGATTVNYSSSGFTRIAPDAIVIGDTTNRIDALQVRIDGGTGGTLGIVNGNGVPLSDDGRGPVGYIYNSDTRLLSLFSTSGLTLASDFQDVLRNVAIQGADRTSTISVNLGRPIYTSTTGHYYEFVPYGQGERLSWTAASTLANTTKTFLGLNGYLASITSQEENDFLAKSFDSKGWIGGQASTVNGVDRTWLWSGTNSPENGKPFWVGNTDGALPPNAYANWLKGEPNNFIDKQTSPNGESYAHFLSKASGTGAAGKWNDLQDSGVNGDSNFSPDGYWVEYSTATGGADTLGSTRGSLTLTPDGGPTGPSAPDLVFYDPASGKVSFAFVGANNTIGSDSLSGDTPLLTFNSNNTSYEGLADWRLVSASLDVDKDGIKDTLYTNKKDGSVVVAFGAARTGTTREYGVRSSAFVTIGGVLGTAKPADGWSIEFASDKIGVGGTPGIFWLNTITGLTAIWTLSAPTGGTTATTSLAVTGNVGGNSGWRAVGDGEFNQDSATRELLWLNNKTNEVATWSLGSDRSTWAIKYALAGGVIPTGWSVSAIGNIAGGTGNDNIVWQNGSRVLVWNMKDAAAISLTEIAVTPTDRIKVIADVDGDGILDLVGQNDGNGTIAAYALTSSFALKNTSAPRTQYFASNNPGGSYRPGKNGSGPALELVNVAQYGA